MSIRNAILTPIVVVVASCGLTSSSRTTRWGGAGAAVTIADNSARFDFLCSVATLESPHPDASGRFSLVGLDTVYFGPSIDTLPSGPYVRPVRITGVQVGDQLSIGVAFTADTSAGATVYDLVRGEPADFSHTACRN